MILLVNMIVLLKNTCKLLFANFIVFYIIVDNNINYTKCNVKDYLEKLFSYTYIVSKTELEKNS